MDQSHALAAELSVSGPAPAGVRRALLVGASATVLALFVAGLVLYVLNGGAEAPNGHDYTLGILIASLSFGLPGAVLSGGNRVPVIGWVSLAAGISLGLDGALTGWALRSLHTVGSLPGGRLALWISVWCWVPGYGLIATLLLLLLPDGRLALRWQRAVAALSLLAITAATAGMAFGPFTYSDLPAGYGGHGNPVLDRTAASVLGWGGVLLIPCVIACLASLIFRFRHAAVEEHEQLKWVALGGGLTVVLFAGAFAPGSQGDVLFAAAMVPLPAGVTIAVLRHGLWDVDLVINRSLVYLALSAVAVLIYLTGVALVNGSLGGLAAVAVIVLVLHPLHARVQGAVNRLLYGDRDDPGLALRRLGDRLSAVLDVEQVLPTAAESVARALRLPYVEVRLADGRGGAYGRPVGAPVVLPLRYQGGAVGELAVSPRETGGRLSARDLRALETIARQLGAAAHAVQLSRELQRSRERIVLAREEERRRLRHELHDDLGPTLAALALELEAARVLMDSDPKRVDATLERAASRAAETVGDVRRIVYGLRPPALDDLGLVGAIREQADRLRSGGLSLTVEAPSEFPPLPAAVEAAAYRIVSEALANMIRHSAARTGSVTVELDGGTLTVRVCDDGRGIDSDAPPGVGLASMRERALELGGTLTIDAAPAGGTRVVARLPLGGS